MSPDKKAFLQFAVFIACLLIFFKVDWRLRGPAANAHQSGIAKELQEIAPPSDAKQFSLNSNVGPDSGVVNQTYLTNHTAAEIEESYSRELARNGWIFKRQEARNDNGVEEFFDTVEMMSR